MKRLLNILLIIPLLISCKSKNEVEFSMDPVTNIEALWQIIDTKYCYVEQKGVDWNAIHDDYIAKAKNIGSDQVKLFDLCAQMLDTLHDGHVNLISYFDQSYNTTWYDAYPANFDTDLQKLYLKDYRIGNGLYYCTILNDSIGYIYYPSFSNSVTSLTWVLYYYFRNCCGVIIDVRNNGGGNMNNSFELAAPFFSENRVVGWWNHKTGPGHNEFSSMEKLVVDTIKHAAYRWLRPVIVLTNRRSYSATNLFVNIMRYADNCTIIGGVTGGGGGMPMSYELPCGWIVRFSSVRMYDADKKDIEQGIKPDILVNMVSTDKDDIIEKAISTILNAVKQ